MNIRVHYDTVKFVRRFIECIVIIVNIGVGCFLTAFVADDRLDEPRSGSQQRPAGDRARSAAVSSMVAARCLLVDDGDLLFRPSIPLLPTFFSSTQMYGFNIYTKRFEFTSPSFGTWVASFVQDYI